MTPSFAATRLVRGLSLLALAAALPAFAQENDFAQECAPVAVHRFLNTANGTHFLTTHVPQKEFLQSYRADLRYEGVAYHAFATKAINSVGVHRIYSGTLGVHFYTTSSSEKDKFIRDFPGATYEGIDHYVPQGMGGGAVEIVRSVSAARNAGWVYARSAAEQQQYSQGNWKSDGVAFYAFPSTIGVDGPDDTGSGAFIPTTSVDQYSATLAKWFGVGAGDMPTVLPGIGRFATSDLGFMKSL